MKIRNALFMGAVWLSALVCVPMHVRAEESENVQTVSGCEVEEIPTFLNNTAPESTDDTLEDNNEPTNQIVLDIPSDVSFLFKSGRVFTVSDSESDIKSSLESSIWFKTETDDEISPDEFSWDSFDVTPGTAGHYYATVTLTFSNNDVQYILPNNIYTFSIPVHIQDGNSLEIYLDSIWSASWGTSFSGTVYVPSDIEITEGNLPAWYCYCGTDKPSVSTLDSLTFSEDTSTFFFCVDYYDGNSSAINIDFSAMPDSSLQGWYAFYTEAGGLRSNYILIDSRDLTGNITYYEGTRGGDTNSDFPAVEQAPADYDGASDDGEDDSSEPESSASDKQPQEPADSVPVSAVPAGSDNPSAAVSASETGNASQSSFMEQDTKDGVTLSGMRIHTLMEAGNSLVVTKNEATAYLSAEALKELGMGSNNVLSLSLTRPEENVLYFSLTVNGVEAKQLPEILITLQNTLYDSSINQTITDESGENIPCHEANGYLAFTVNASGKYIVTDNTAASSLPKQLQLGNSASNQIAQENSSPNQISQGHSSPNQIAQGHSLPNQITQPALLSEQKASETNIAEKGFWEEFSPKPYSAVLFLTAFAVSAVALSAFSLFYYYRRK